VPSVAVCDIQIYYDIHGTGPRLLAISGTGGDLRQSPNIFEMPPLPSTLRSWATISAVWAKPRGQMSPTLWPIMLPLLPKGHLHVLSQIGFDWTDFHLHHFHIRKKD
jgi:hypothetical protein